MKMTRGNFLQTIAGMAAASSIPSLTSAAPPAQPKIKLGVSLYSYTGDFNVTMNLEDCIADVADMGAEGVEILCEAHIPGYPNPSEKWIEYWHSLMAKYKTKPTCYSCWVDSMLHKNRRLNLQESLDFLLLDLKLANKLGFKVMRPKFGLASEIGAREVNKNVPANEYEPPVTQVVEKALPYAEKYDVKIAIEVGIPFMLKNEPFVDDMMELISKTETRHFGIVPDFSLFAKNEGRPGATPPYTGNDPKDLLKYLPYSHHMHGKFWKMKDDLQEATLKYDEIMPVLIQGGYDGYISSEYEGPRELFAGSDQVRMHQAMLRRLLG